MSAHRGEYASSWRSRACDFMSPSQKSATLPGESLHFLPLEKSHSPHGHLRPNHLAELRR